MDQPIALLGDIAFNGTFSSSPESIRNKFSASSIILKECKLVFANLEVPVKVDDARNEYKNFVHYSLHATNEELLKFLNISCVSLANNHIYDCSMTGLRATINLLDDLGIYHTGAGWMKEHTEPVIIKGNGIKIGFIAYVDKSTHPLTEYFSDLYINYLNEQKTVSDIKNLKSNVDKIICSVHWGNDYSNFYTGSQKELAHKLIDAGADVIMGHHTHTIQSYEVYKNKAIFYSLGQLCFGDFIWEGELRSLKRKTKLGLLVRFDDYSFTKYQIIPTKQEKGGKIIISNRNIENFLKRLQTINRLRNQYRLIDYLVRFKEAYIDRIYEFIFGYYRNPLKDIFRIKNFKKLKFMVRDFKSHH